MVSDAASIVLFAIRSSIKLGQQMRQAYVDATKGRALVLPLPNFVGQPDISSAVSYFSGAAGQAHAASIPTLVALLQKPHLTPEETQEVCTCHIEFINLDLAKAGKLGVSPDGTRLDYQGLESLFTIRQWQRGSDPNPSTLQRVAGSLVEIGIDYFANVPGALNKDSRQGKAIAGFLDALSEIKFSETQLGELPGRLFVAALETISEDPGLFSGDPKVQDLIKVATISVSTDVAKRLDELGGGNLLKAERVQDWAELVFRSVLSSAGGLVLADPKRYLGLNQPGEIALVSHVGESVLGLVLDGENLGFDRLFSKPGLEQITKSALEVLGDHPEILIRSNNAGLPKLLGAIAKELSQFDTILTPDLLPELTRLILEKTGENPALLWPDLATTPEKHLLLTAASITLAILSKRPSADQKWQLQFSSRDLLVVVDAIFTELAANPTWLRDQAGALNGNLKLTLESTLEVLRSRADARLNAATAVAVLRMVVTKAGLRQEFLDESPQATQPIIVAAVDAIFKSVFDDQLDARAAWQVVRSDVLTHLVELSLEQLAKVRLTPEKITALAAFLKTRIAALAGGGALDLQTWETELAAALAHP